MFLFLILRRFMEVFLWLRREAMSCNKCGMTMSWIRPSLSLGEGFENSGKVVELVGDFHWFQSDFVIPGYFLDTSWYFLEFVLISCPWPMGSGDVLDPRMEIAIKYFVMTELFVCNFVCRCFFWEESNLAPRQQNNTAYERFVFFCTCDGAKWYCCYSESYRTWWVAFELQFFVQHCLWCIGFVLVHHSNLLKQHTQTQSHVI